MNLILGLLRLLTLRPCREPYCTARMRCWRWHVEIETCPTCGTDVDEFHPRVGDVVRARLVAQPTITYTAGSWPTSGNFTTYGGSYR